MNKDEQQYFQDRVDELALLGRDADERLSELTSLHRFCQSSYNNIATDLKEKMMAVDRSLSNIRIASENIAGYMEQCEKHANRTRNIFMAAVVGCVIIVAGTLWWANHLKNSLAEDIKTFNKLETLLKNEPVVIRADNHNYVRIVEGSETDDLYDKDKEHRIDGHYARIWYKK